MCDAALEVRLGAASDATCAGAACAGALAGAPPAAPLRLGTTLAAAGGGAAAPAAMAGAWCCCRGLSAFRGRTMGDRGVCLSTDIQETPWLNELGTAPAGGGSTYSALR